MKRALWIVLLLILFIVPPTGAAPIAAPDAPMTVSTTVVISQVYGGGNNSGATYQNDFVELFNLSSSTVSLAGWSIQYASATGTGYFAANTPVSLSGSLAPGQYYLVKLAGGTTNGVALPAADLTGTINMSGTAGKVALVNTTTGLPCNGGSTPCSSADLAKIIDLIGYGTANFFEGSAAAPAPSNTTADLRAGGGCTDTDQNNGDFTAVAPIPRNSASPTNTCTVVDTAPTVTGTDPTNGATNVAVGSDLEITFSKNVTMTGEWFQIDCPTSGIRAVADTAVSGGPKTFTINPTNDFAAKETCTVTVWAAQVADQDDAANLMATDYVWSFTTDIPPTVVSTSPANGAPGVAPGSNITVNFSEPVTIANIDSFFDILCDGTLRPAAGSGGPTSFTIDPTADLPDNKTCTVTIKAAEVVDQDAPTDQLDGDNDGIAGGNYVFTFTTAAADPCGQAYTPIYSIQGSGLSAAITGAVTTQGVVVGDFELPSGSNQIRGFYLQDLNGDSNPATSDGIFVYNGGVDTVVVGQVVRVAGTAGENQNQTQISGPTTLQCGATGNIAPIDITLPFASADYPERYEGMLVNLPQMLYVTEHFQLGRFGQVVMTSQDDRLQQPTNVTTPGAAALALQAANDLNRIIIDDNNNLQNADPIVFGRGGNPLSASNTLRGGDRAANIVGVLVYDWAGNSDSGNAYRVRPIGALNGGVINFQAVNTRPASPSVTGRLRVTAANTLNYFNTFGDGACTGGVGGAATDCRGATNSTEFARQWPKTVASLVGGGADVIGLMEIENDGYGESSAIQHLVDRLNAATALGTYAFINPDTTAGTNSLGTDAIKVALIYKPAKVAPVGTTAVLNTTDFVTGGDGADRNRPALAQAFEEFETGERFIVVVNHLKSKGSACDEPAALDGQGNCNAVRTAAANVMTAWLAANPSGTGDPDILIMGDLNSYAKEDPITAIKGAGYVNLIENRLGVNAYSYAFDGQWGYLDHALASSALNAQVAGVTEWHINADEPSVLDYNTEFKSTDQIASLFYPDKFRSSDHDPVIVGLNLTIENDLSDLPAPYGAAWHTGSVIRLGATWAAGHSPVGGGTNDGVVRTPNFSWSHATGGSVNVTVAGSGYVTGWIDWNNDRDFGDTGEQIFANEEFTAQTRTITFPIPDVTVAGATLNARFRLYGDIQTALAAASGADAPDAAPSPLGGATGGEVEDYAWAFPPTAVTLSSFGAAASGPWAGLPAAAGLLGLAGLMLSRRRGK